MAVGARVPAGAAGLAELTLRSHATARGRAAFGVGVAMLATAIALLAADLLRGLGGPTSPRVLSSSGSPGDRKML